MESSGGATVRNWSEALEDLIHDGDIDQAVAVLENKVSYLENQLQKKQEKEDSQTFEELSAALHDLSKIYSAKGFSLKADQALSSMIRCRGRGLQNGRNRSSYIALSRNGRGH